jgi:lipopolysaccharide export system protein LptA
VTTEVKCSWTLHLEVVKGRTILTARAGKEISFRVDCQRLELQAPQGSIQAVGDVKLASAALNGTSDRLTVSLQEDQIVLEGHASLTSARDGQSMEVKGERLSLRIASQDTGKEVQTVDGPSPLVSPK